MAWRGEAGLSWLSCSWENDDGHDTHARSNSTSSDQAIFAPRGCFQVFAFFSLLFSLQGFKNKWTRLTRMQAPPKSAELTFEKPRKDLGMMI